MNNEDEETQVISEPKEVHMTPEKETNIQDDHHILSL